MKRHRSTVLCSAILAGALMALPGPSLAQQKTAKQCDADWQANKAAIQASGKTKKDYVAGCRQGSGNAAVQPAGRAAISASSKPQAAAKNPPRDTRTAVQAPATRARPDANARATTQTAPKASPRNTGNAAAAQYSSVLAAKAHCPTDTVVWVNKDSKVYHYSDSARYGKTKDGAYMCEKDTAAAGFRAAKNEKSP
jgi:hypothetical protein